MKRSLPGLALLACAAIAAGCGGDEETTTASASADAPASIADIQVDTGPFESETEFTDAVNGFCETSAEIYSRTPVYGVSAAGLEAEFTTLLQNEQEDLAKTESIEAPDEVADEWDAYNEASADLNAQHEKVLAAASKGDADKANDILFGSATDATDELQKANDEIGLECVDLERGASETEPAGEADGAAEAPEPSNTIDEAADEFLAALQSGDCAEIVAASHSQSGASEEAFADPETGDCSAQAERYGEGEILGTAQFGPIGMAIFSTAPGEFAYEDFVIDSENDGRLMHTGGLYADGNGLDAPNEGIDADATVQAFLDAIRADDDEALNETLTVESLPQSEGGFIQDGPIKQLGNDPDYGKAIVDDIRADEAAEPVLLGVNQIHAEYLVDTAEGNDYILVLTHQPGSETAYRVNAYWALPTE